MKIISNDHLASAEVRAALHNGARLVRYEYCVSPVIFSVRRRSPVHLVRRGETDLLPKLAYVAISLIAGWWGLPWGPVLTLKAVRATLSGGRDVPVDSGGPVSAQWPQ